jgi:fructose-1,6-bisphosphatase I
MDSMKGRRITLERHLRDEAGRARGPAAGLPPLLTALAGAAKVLARQVRRAALSGGLGYSGDVNVTGDSQKKLDVTANETVLDAVASTGLVAAVVSEELKGAKALSDRAEARYVLCTDPLDGSSNTDINGSVGTIFGIYPRSGGGAADEARDLLRSGSEQIAAGYVMYGPGTILVYTSGDGVFGFTLDEDSGEFVLTHDRIRCPSRGHYYSANLGHLKEWHPGIRKCIEHLTENDPATGRPYSLRYVGALVADLHRSLIEGGFYFYPADHGHTNGKLRLLYECAPLALVAEQAGGRASTGTQRILDVRAGSIHQRVPLVIGSALDVELYETFMRREP